MFTGIIEVVGQIISTDRLADDLQLRVDISALLEKSVDQGLAKPIALGDSIAVNGVCLTVAAMTQNIADFYVSAETLDKTLLEHYVPLQYVNLETALTLSTPLGGHIVSGHVDGVCELVKRMQSGDGFVYTFKVSPALAGFIASKGSVTLDGISLTSNAVRDESDASFFDVALVPHTINNTNLQHIKEGGLLHIEIDVLARYMQRMLDYSKTTQA